MTNIDEIFRGMLRIPPAPEVAKVIRILCAYTYPTDQAFQRLLERCYVSQIERCPDCNHPILEHGATGCTHTVGGDEATTGYALMAVERRCACTERAVSLYAEAADAIEDTWAIREREQEMK